MNPKKKEKVKKKAQPEEIELEGSKEYRKKILLDLDEEFDNVNLEQDLKFDLDEFDGGYDDELDDE